MRLVRLNLLSLEERRTLIDELVLYKIKNAFYRITTTFNFETSTLRHTRAIRQFYLPFVTTNVEYHTPLLRMHRHHMEIFSQNSLIEHCFKAFKMYIIHTIINSSPVDSSQSHLL